MGDAASCHHCTCEDPDQQPVTQHVMVRNVPFDSSSEEEISDPQDRCTSWGTSRESTSEETPPCLRRPGQWKRHGSHEHERRLHFKLEPAARFGLQLAEIGDSDSSLSSILVVVKVESTSSFYRDVDGKAGIHEGDAIVEVNGRRGTAEEVRNSLQQAVISSGSKSITMCVLPRPATLHVTLKPGGTSSQKLGVVAVIDKQNPDCLLVQSVRHEGMVPAWNASQPKLRVCAGDLITEVNGISRDSTAMCKALQAVGQGCELHLHVLTNDSGDVVRRRKLQEVRQLLEVSPRLVMEPVSPTSSSGAESGRLGAPTTLAGNYALKQTILDLAEDNSSDVSTDLPSVGSASPVGSFIDCTSG